MVDTDHHSDDSVEVFHGLVEPAIGCGYHVTFFPERVFEAHRLQLAQTAKTG
jgi:hypothetical protein